MRRGIVALLLVAVSACGGGAGRSPAPAEAQQSASSGASPHDERLELEEPSPPPSPRVARERHARDFLRFFVSDQYAYAMRTGFTFGLGKYALPGCTECDRVIGVIDDHAARDRVAVLAPVRVDRVSLIRGPWRPEPRVTAWELEFRLRIAHGRIVDPDGSVVVEHSGITDRQRLVVLDTPGGWYVADWESRAAAFDRGGDPVPA